MRKENSFIFTCGKCYSLNDGSVSMGKTKCSYNNVGNQCTHVYERIKIVCTTVVHKNKH